LTGYLHSALIVPTRSLKVTLLFLDLVSLTASVKALLAPGASVGSALP
jgi:hypothetical protein